MVFFKSDTHTQDHGLLGQRQFGPIQVFSVFFLFFLFFLHGDEILDSCFC